MRKKRLLLFIVGVFILTSSVAVRANPDGPKLMSPEQYSEHKIGYSVNIEWNKPDSKYGAVDHYIVGVRGFQPEDDVEASDTGSVVIKQRMSLE